MNSRLWRACAEQYLIPHLPGRWKVKDNLLYTRLDEWIVCAVHPHHYKTATFKVERLVQFLAQPHPYRNGPFYTALPRKSPTDVLIKPESVEKAGPVMSRILTSIQEDALPFFAQAGTLDGYKNALVAMYPSSSIDCAFLEKLCYIHVIRGDIVEAQDAALRVVTAPEQYTEEYMAAVSARVREVTDLAVSDLASAQSLLRRWAADTWKEISKAGH